MRIIKIERKRPISLSGSTCKIKTRNGDGDTINIYITINEDENNIPFEIFINCSDSSIYEMLSVSMILISRLLRHGVSLDIIAKDLEDVHSNITGYFSGKQWIPSLIARIGKELRKHGECNDDI